MILVIPHDAIEWFGDDLHDAVRFMIGDEAIHMIDIKL